jgi:hypothetical protein
MRGVVIKIEDSSTIVMFNNGKIGRIPTPPGCKSGRVITVSFNRKLIFFPVTGMVLLIILGCIFGFLMLARGISPENFCRKPFAEKNIVIPNSEYGGYEELFAHIGQPLREFTTDYPVVKNDGDLVRGFNYEQYNIVTYYDYIYSKVIVFEIILNSKSTRFTGKFSIGDDKSLIEKYFSSYIKGTKKDVAFSCKNNNIQFAMGNTVLTFRFNGKNKLGRVHINEI